MGMLLYGLKNIYRNKLRTFIVITLISLPFFSVLMMVAMEEGIDAQIAKVKKNIGNVIQVKPRGGFGTVNIAGGLNKPLPEETADRMRTIEHVTKVTPYLTAIEPIAGYYMTLHIGVRAGDRKRLGSHGEVGYPKIIIGRDFAETDNGRDVAILGNKLFPFAIIVSFSRNYDVNMWQVSKFVNFLMFFKPNSNLSLV